MYRLIFTIVLIVFLIIFSIPDAIVYFIVKQVDKKTAEKMTHTIVSTFLRILRFISGVNVHIKGKENIDETEPLLIIANHRGFFDIITGFPLLKRNCSIVAKVEFLHVPIMSYWMKRLGCFFLDRKDLRSGVTMVVDSINKLKNGTSIWIFPEGTRNKNENSLELLEFKAGAFKIAEKSNCKILPIAFYGTEKIFENNKPYIEKGDVYINIGKSYRMSDLSDDERQDIGNYNRNLILKLLKEIVDEKG